MSNASSQLTPKYDAALVQPMRDDLTRVGFVELHGASAVEQALSEQKGTALLFINSVCGCSAKAARPAVMQALQHHVIPDRLLTVFAGQDIEATQAARRYIADHPPSSPCVALFKEGEVVAVFQRSDMVRRRPEEITAVLTATFDQICNRPGPSIPASEFETIVPFVTCVTAASRGQPGSPHRS